MHVEMRARISGTRNGEDWPPVGGVVDLPEAEARALIALGAAVEVATTPEPEVSKPRRGRTATAAEPETR